MTDATAVPLLLVFLVGCLLQYWIIRLAVRHALADSRRSERSESGPVSPSRLPLRPAPPGTGPVSGLWSRLRYPGGRLK